MRSGKASYDRNRQSGIEKKSLVGKQGHKEWFLFRFVTASGQRKQSESQRRTDLWMFAFRAHVSVEHRCGELVRLLLGTKIFFQHPTFMT